jgi:predicted unusual protein kinase regulating ubiquinone biosynthesis (AarF/ABC1/UbiB family)
MEPVLSTALGGPVAKVLREIDTTPIGTASIGQVYRATTLDGREVAVKVQYPKIVAAAQADLKNLGMLLRLSRTLMPSVDLGALASELTDRFTEELDYEREAVNTLDLAKSYEGHPSIKVPSPVLELCGRSVIVTEHISGLDFEAACKLPAERRNQVGEVVGRFYLGSFFRLGRFSGDPHPGNIKVLDDGRVGFIDFGSFKRLDPRMVRFVEEVLRAVSDGRGDQLIAALGKEGVFARPDRVNADEIIDYARATCGWFLIDGDQTMTPMVASEAILATIAPATGFHQSLRGQDLPVEWTLLLRTVVATMALLGQLEASANWHRIAREWIYHDPPATPLGEAEQSFFD